MEIKNNIKNKLRLLAEDAVKVFNAVSTETSMQYIQQSPLDFINKPIETMVIGINPGSAQPGITSMTAEEFLKGNPCWSKRFENEREGAEVSKEWSKYFGNAHYFICGDQRNHAKGFDDNAKTVWTNLTPFSSVDSSQLKDIHYKVALPFLIQLLTILRPRKIILLGTNAFNTISRYCDADMERAKVVRDKQGGLTLEIGTVDGIPAIQLPHPSNNWGCHNLIAPVFFKMWEICLKEKLSLRNSAEKMRLQLTRLEPIDD